MDECTWNECLFAREGTITSSRELTRENFEDGDVVKDTTTNLLYHRDCAETIRRSIGY